ncbi:MAG: tRNA (N6-threonylcarbamoyladenosine(37)-N6)-methyltransferase TrmO [Pseudomonadota bacterium]|nr:tRNA (N6-threonylcarbamoyladenosine(37)-N6)-methyltransferase TrmO [Pseudomonadota bacterium]
MTSDTLTLRPIGVLSTPFRTLDECPRNGCQPDPPPLCHARVAPEFVAGLQNLEGFTHLLVLYWLHRVQTSKLVIVPPFDGQPRGVFSSRSPMRPNPIGLSLTAFEGFAEPGVLRLRYLDCLDGTPLLDIKPYLPTTDSEPGAAMGWLAPHRTRPADQ